METKNISCGMFVILFLIIWLPLSMWSDRNLDFWISHFKGEAADVPFWVSALATLAGNGLALIANLIGEICRPMV